MKHRFYLLLTILLMSLATTLRAADSTSPTLTVVIDKGEDAPPVVDTHDFTNAKADNT